MTIALLCFWVRLINSSASPMPFALRSILTWSLLVAYGLVVVAGEAVHGLGCCTFDGALGVVAASSGSGCAHQHGVHDHGHDHSHESPASTGGKSGAPEKERRHRPHDSDECFVCQLLSAAQETPSIAELPLAIELPEDAPLICASVAFSFALSPRQTRGPPV